jgi:LysM repeat protein
MAVAWLALPLLAAAGPPGATQLTQATASTATTASSSISSISSASTPQTAPAPRPATLTAVTRAAAPPAAAATAPGQPVTWTVRPGDTLSGIAAALSVHGGWPALYAANRQHVGPNPGAIRPGTVLTVPGTGSAARYTVAAGDTLTGIAAALSVHGGWPALYAANRPQAGPDASTLRAGTVLTVPHTAASGASAGKAPSSTTSPRSPGNLGAPAVGSIPPVGTSSPPAGISSASGHSTSPTGTAPGQQPRATSPSAGTMPRWLKATLLGAALLTGLAFLAEPGVVLARRRMRLGPSRGAGGGHLRRAR